VQRIDVRVLHDAAAGTPRVLHYLEARLVTGTTNSLERKHERCMYGKQLVRVETLHPPIDNN